MIALLLFAALAAAQDPSRQASEAMRAGKYAEAERIYRLMLKEDPANPHLHMNLGLALHSGRKYAEAIAEFKRFLQAQPQPGPVHLLLGAAQLKLGRACDAIEPLEKARQWQANE